MRCGGCRASTDNVPRNDLKASAGPTFLELAGDTILRDIDAIGDYAKAKASDHIAAFATAYGRAPKITMPASFFKAYSLETRWYNAVNSKN